FEFHYDVASFLSYYNQFLSLVGLSKLTGINKAQLSHYIQGFRNPSVQTAKKIQLALNNFADELKSIQFT
ncbi:helix-turn-helix domain-containing protein, partial [Ornithobacterium rhinotracheale]